VTSKQRARRILIVALLAGAVLFVYAQVGGFGFVGLDDNSYVSDNPHVMSGLTASGIAWAWTTSTETHWAPLTFMSFMLDAQVGGPGPRLFHLTNLALHLLNTILLFFVLARMTGCAVRSGLVAALFAVHPLHVESVAWITERKDVLSGLFWFLALWAYARYVETRSPWRYAAVALAYILGLLSKSMIVTLPAVLLILDFWPLKRFAGAPPEPRARVSKKAARAGAATVSPATVAPPAAPAWRRLVLEKAPLALLALPVSWIAWRGQSGSGTLGTFDQYPIGMRAANGLVSSGMYLWQTIWPSGLAVPYPYWPESLTTLRVAAAAGVFAALSALALLTARTRPWFLTGWLWYLVVLLPVSGIVQAGSQSRADRYTYLPLVGIFVMVVWGAAEALAPVLSIRPRARVVALVVAAGLVAVLAMAARVQAGYWKSTETLFTRALAITDRNAVAENGLGLLLLERGDVEEALAHFLRAVSYWPSYAEAHVNAASALLRLGRSQEAADHYAAADRTRRPDTRVLVRLGAALLDAGQPEKAIEPLTRAVQMEPGNANINAQLGAALARTGRGEEALVYLAAAARARPDSALVQLNLGIGLASLGRLDPAEKAMQEAVRLEPANASAHKNLGVVYARLGRFPEAVTQLEEAARLDPSDEGTRRNLERARTMLSR
jgi:tetratricopeptide (TPR) repeat protein